MGNKVCENFDLMPVTTSFFWKVEFEIRQKNGDSMVTRSWAHCFFIPSTLTSHRAFSASCFPLPCPFILFFLFSHFPSFLDKSQSYLLLTPSLGSNFDFCRSPQPLLQGPQSREGCWEGSWRYFYVNIALALVNFPISKSVFSFSLKETGVQRGQVCFPRPHSSRLLGPGLSGKGLYRSSPPEGVFVLGEMLVVCKPLKSKWKIYVKSVLFTVGRGFLISALSARTLWTIASKRASRQRPSGQRAGNAPSQGRVWWKRSRGFKSRIFHLEIDSVPWPGTSLFSSYCFEMWGLTAELLKWGWWLRS